MSPFDSITCPFRWTASAGARTSPSTSRSAMPAPASWSGSSRPEPADTSTTRTSPFRRGVDDALVQAGRGDRVNALSVCRAPSGAARGDGPAGHRLFRSDDERTPGWLRTTRSARGCTTISPGRHDEHVALITSLEPGPVSGIQRKTRRWHRRAPPPRPDQPHRTELPVGSRVRSARSAAESEVQARGSGRTTRR
jgi:hypothetical protein